MVNKKLLLLTLVVIFCTNQLSASFSTRCTRTEPKMAERSQYLFKKIEEIENRLQEKNKNLLGRKRKKRLNQTRSALQIAEADYSDFMDSCIYGRPVKTMNSSGKDVAPGEENNAANFKSWKTNKRHLVRWMQYLLTKIQRLINKSSGKAKELLTEDRNRLKACLDIYDAFYKSFESGNNRK